MEAFDTNDSALASSLFGFDNMICEGAAVDASAAASDNIFTAQDGLHLESEHMLPSFCVDLHTSAGFPSSPLFDHGLFPDFDSSDLLSNSTQRNTEAFATVAAPQHAYPNSIPQFIDGVHNSYSLQDMLRDDFRPMPIMSHSTHHTPFQQAFGQFQQHQPSFPSLADNPEGSARINQQIHDILHGDFVTNVAAPRSWHPTTQQATSSVNIIEHLYTILNGPTSDAQQPLESMAALQCGNTGFVQDEWHSEPSESPSPTRGRSEESTVEALTAAAEEALSASSSSISAAASTVSSASTPTNHALDGLQVLAAAVVFQDDRAACLDFHEALSKLSRSTNPDDREQGRYLLEAHKQAEEQRGNLPHVCSLIRHVPVSRVIEVTYRPDIPTRNKELREMRPGDDDFKRIKAVLDVARRRRANKTFKRTSRSRGPLEKPVKVQLPQA